MLMFQVLVDTSDGSCDSVGILLVPSMTFKIIFLAHLNGLTIFLQYLASDTKVLFGFSFLKLFLL